MIAFEADFGNQLATSLPQRVDLQGVQSMTRLIVDQEVPSSTLGASTNTFNNLDKNLLF